MACVLQGGLITHQHVVESDQHQAQEPFITTKRVEASGWWLAIPCPKSGQSLLKFEEGWSIRIHALERCVRCNWDVLVFMSTCQD